MKFCSISGIAVAVVTTLAAAASAWADAPPAGSRVVLCGDDPSPSPSRRPAPQDYQSCAAAGEGAQGPAFFATSSGCAAGFSRLDDDGWSSVHPVRIGQGRCQRMSVVCVSPSRQRAGVQCDGEASTDVYWVNLESLSCAPRNLATYSPTALPSDHENCNGSGVAGSDSGSGSASPGPRVNGSTLPVRGATMAAALRVAGAAHRCAMATALDTVRTIQLSLQEGDNAAILSRFEALPADELRARIRRAAGALGDRCGRGHAIFGPDCASAPPSVSGNSELAATIEQGQRVCREVCGAAQAASGELQEISGLSGDTAVKSSFDEFTGPLVINMVNADDRQLAVRTALYEGLAPRDRPALDRMRSSAEWSAIERAAGMRLGPDFTELHNGYVFGGTRIDPHSRGFDCSQFISNVYGLQLPVTDKNGRRSVRPPATDQLEQVARYVTGETNRPPDPPWNSLASCFRPVNLRAGELPQAADIVVQRAGRSGHVVMVTDYDPVNDPYNVQTIEAAGGTFNTVGNYHRALFDPICGSDPSDRPPVRSDVAVIRFVGGPHCPAHPPTGNCSAGQ